MNHISLIGRLTSNIEIRYTQSNKAVTGFSLAVKRPYTKDETDFISCVAWGGTAEFLGKYFGKGQMVAIEGYLTMRKYDDKDGNSRTVYEVVVEKCHFCGEKKASNPEENTFMPPPAETQAVYYPLNENDDCSIPF